MRTTRVLGTLLIIAGGVAVFRLVMSRSQLRQTRQGAPIATVTRSTAVARHEDCAVSECGEDGLPLSAYAG